MSYWFCLRVVGGSVPSNSCRIFESTVDTLRFTWFFTPRSVGSSRPFLQLLKGYLRTLGQHSCREISEVSLSPYTSCRAPWLFLKVFQILQSLPGDFISLYSCFNSTPLTTFPLSNEDKRQRFTKGHERAGVRVLNTPSFFSSTWNVFYRLLILRWDTTLR